MLHQQQLVVHQFVVHTRRDASSIKNARTIAYLTPGVSESSVAHMYSEEEPNASN